MLRPDNLEKNYLFNRNIKLNDLSLFNEQKRKATNMSESYSIIDECTIQMGGKDLSKLDPKEAHKYRKLINSDFRVLLATFSYPDLILDQ